MVDEGSLEMHTAPADLHARRDPHTVGVLPPLADSSASDDDDAGDDDSDSDHEVSMRDAVPGIWEAAERYSGIELKDDNPTRRPTALRHVAVHGHFTASKTFDGVRNGYVFRTGDHGTGYYVDNCTSKAKVILTLHGQLPPASGCDDRLVDRPPAKHARNPKWHSPAHQATLPCG